MKKILETFLNFQELKNLYIHWPFCPYRCFYCPFVALAGQDEFMYSYHLQLMSEISTFFNNDNCKHNIRSIFLGGGTPSTYPIKMILDMYDKLNSVISFENEYEFTIEVNPGTVNKEKLDVWRSIGINRLSIGVQSLNDQVLKNLNRHQKKDDVINLIKEASNLFDNISIDLIIGLPNISEIEWKNFIKEVINWPISHISIYFLTIHEDTPLYFSIKQNKVNLPQDDFVVDLYYWTIDQLENVGIFQYEISNFSKIGKESIHNKAYWSRVPYKGFGLGAWSFDGIKRYQNTKNLLDYINKVKNNENLIALEDIPNRNEILFEIIMLGLRQFSGLNISKLLERLSDNEKLLFLDSVNNLIKEKLIYKSSNNESQEIIKISIKGITVVNEVILKLTSFLK